MPCADAEPQDDVTADHGLERGVQPADVQAARQVEGNRTITHGIAGDPLLLGINLLLGERERERIRIADGNGYPADGYATRCDTRS